MTSKIHQREAVAIEPRKSMTMARKLRIHTARGGKCWMCGKPVPIYGPDVRYDHRLPLELGGVDADDNLWPLHTAPCDKIKTQADRRRIDKAKRIVRKAEKEPEPSRLQGRGFDKSLSKRMDGSVVRRDKSSH